MGEGKFGKGPKAQHHCPRLCTYFGPLSLQKLPALDCSHEPETGIGGDRPSLLQERPEPIWYDRVVLGWGHLVNWKVKILAGMFSDNSISLYSTNFKMEKKAMLFYLQTRVYFSYIDSDFRQKQKALFLSLMEFILLELMSQVLMVLWTFFNHLWNSLYSSHYQSASSDLGSPRCVQPRLRRLSIPGGGERKKKPHSLIGTQKTSCHQASLCSGSREPPPSNSWPTEQAIQWKSLRILGY